MHFSSSTGISVTGRALHLVDWTGEGDDVAQVVLCHGYGEHSGRYDQVASRLVGAGYGVHSYDQLGHGRSAGKFGRVDDLGALVGDLEARVMTVQDAHPEQSVFLLGHSMGGLVVLTALAQGDITVDGAVVTGPAVTTGEDLPDFLVTAVKLLGRVVPFLPVRTIDSATLSRDPEVVAAYDADPYVYRGAIDARTGGQLAAGADWLDAHLSDIGTPLLVVHGSADKLTSPAGSRLVHEKASSKDKTLRIWDGLYHEVMNEPEQDQVLGEIVDWLDAHR
jgi:acylglycerol lipase